ncbi:MAG TPA: IS1634 family transposase [Candidatus Competibacteraceae bacterium]|nr:IS1634 family transposase [Candidatus Competibacteraceae bacterium]
MYIATVPNRNSPPAILLRESYREGGQVRTRTLANLTAWKPERLKALRRALKGDFDGMDGDPTSGPIFGVTFALQQLAQQVGLTQALGRSTEGKLILFLVLARIAHGGSRLSAVRWAQQHAVAELLGLAQVDEDALYRALDWLAEQQATLEQRLYRDYVRRIGQPPVLVLYDVTSSYLEGEQNELGAFGYNRDGKRGKLQVVIGLLTADDGEPLAVRVFEGNTADPSTLTAPITILKQQFGVETVVLVGDRGMLKTKGKAALSSEQWKYITALTNAQIRTLLKRGVLQPELFDTALCEVEHEGRRLILRRNEAVRAREAHRRADKLERLQTNLAQRNALVAQSSRAKPETGLVQLTAWVKRHHLHSYVTLTLQGRTLLCTVDEAALAHSALLDGCYTLETDVPATQLKAERVDARYRDLQQVERNFRTLKTDFLEIRPIFLRKANRTRAHVFVALLALKVVRLFEQKLRAAFGTTAQDPMRMTVADALVVLSRLTYLYYRVQDQTYARLPQLDEQQLALFDALGITLPRQPAATV